MSIENGEESSNNYKKDYIIDSKKGLIREFTKYEVQKVNNSFQERYKSVIEKYPRLSRLFNAMKKTNFFPEPEIIEYFLKMGTQESSLAWSPKLDYSKSGIEGRKKKEIKKNIDFLKEKLNSWLGNVGTFLIFNEEEKKEIYDFISKLENIYNNKKATEYELYVVTNEISNFIKKMRNKHSLLNSYITDEINEKIDYLNHNPSSFGIWQINVDLFLEKIKKNNIISKFPEISKLDNERQRDELVKALCGESKILNRDRTMELIIEGHLKPRYLNHNRGKNNDLKYMVVENLTGEMSTYYSAIQKKLNERLLLNPHMKIDGILYVKQKYSNNMDFEKTKKYGTTYKTIIEFIKKSKNQELINNYKKLTKELFNADSFEKLSKSILYKEIMGEKLGERIITDDMKSSNQTAEQYYEMIKRK